MVLSAFFFGIIGFFHIYNMYVRMNLHTHV